VAWAAWPTIEYDDVSDAIGDSFAGAFGAIVIFSVAQEAQ